MRQSVYCTAGDATAEVHIRQTEDEKVRVEIDAERAEGGSRWVSVEAFKARDSRPFKRLLPGKV
jgi:hypothetical protein